jgi:threonine dehydratase
MIRETCSLVGPHVRATPLLPYDDPDTGVRMHLKLENLQRNGAFKARPAAALMLGMPRALLAGGVCTASSGNFGIAVAAQAAALGVPAAIVVPDDAPVAKLDRLRALGARIVPVPPAEWWTVITTRRSPHVRGVYLDAVADPRAQAGSGGIGLELVEQLPDVDTVFVPFGGGGLLCGIAAALKALRPRARIVACESELATPLAAARSAGGPVPVTHRPGFVSGIGARSVLPEMWPLLERFVDDVAVLSLEEIAGAIRALALTARVVAEGAGAASVAAARSGRFGSGRMACVVSGGNIGAEALAAVLSGSVPEA